MSLDIHTSWKALSDKEPSQNASVIRAVISEINNMIIDLMAEMLHKDWMSLRQQQKQRIEKAHEQVKYVDKHDNHERHKKVIY